MEPARHVTKSPLHIKSAHDAHIVFEAVRLGLLPMIRRRLSGTERAQLRPGDIFVWEEAAHKGGLERWTDGRKWSASRMREPFLFYEEKVPRSPREKGYFEMQSPTSPVGGGMNPSGMSGMPMIAGGPVSGGGMGGGPYGQTYLPTPTSINDMSPGGLGPAGLTKQTYSAWVTFPDTNGVPNADGYKKKWHLTAYFSASTFSSLPGVNDDALLRSVQVPAGVYETGKGLMRKPPNSSGGRLEQNHSVSPPTVFASSTPGSPYGTASFGGPIRTGSQPSSSSASLASGSSSSSPFGLASGGGMYPPTPNSASSYGFPGSPLGMVHQPQHQPLYPPQPYERGHLAQSQQSQHGFAIPSSHQQQQPYGMPSYPSFPGLHPQTDDKASFQRSMPGLVHSYSDTTHDRFGGANASQSSSAYQNNAFGLQQQPLQSPFGNQFRSGTAPGGMSSSGSSAQQQQQPFSASYERHSSSSSSPHHGAHPSTDSSSATSTTSSPGSKSDYSIQQQQQPRRSLTFMNPPALPSTSSYDQSASQLLPTPSSERGGPSSSSQSGNASGKGPMGVMNITLPPPASLQFQPQAQQQQQPQQSQGMYGTSTTDQQSSFNPPYAAFDRSQNSSTAFQSYGSAVNSTASPAASGSVAFGGMNPIPPFGGSGMSGGTGGFVVPVGPGSTALASPSSLGWANIVRPGPLTAPVHLLGTPLSRPSAEDQQSQQQQQGGSKQDPAEGAGTSGIAKDIEGYFPFVPPSASGSGSSSPTKSSAAIAAGYPSPPLENASGSTTAASGTVPTTPGGGAVGRTMEDRKAVGAFVVAL